MDLSNSNMLDDSFSNFASSKNGRIKTIYPTALPSGDRLEDEFGGSASYPSFNEMLPLSTLVEPMIIDAGFGNMYESTPYGYYLKPDSYSNFVCDEISSFTTDEEYASFIGDHLEYVGQMYSNDEMYSEAKGRLKAWVQKQGDKAKEVVQNVKSTAKDVTRDIKKGFQNVKSEIGKGFENVKSGVKKGFDNVKNWVKENTKDGKALHHLNKVNPAFIAMRGAIIGLLEKNVVGIATSFAAIKEKGANRYEEVQEKWYKWGGDKKRFDEAVQSGRNKKKLFLDIVLKAKGKKGFDGEYYYAEGEEEKNPAKMVMLAASSLGALSGVLASIPSPDPATKGVAAWTGVGGAGIGALGGIMKSFAKDMGASEEELAEIPENPDPKDSELPTDEEQLKALQKSIESEESTTLSSKEMEDDDKILGMSKPLFFTLTGILVVGGGFLAYKLIKKK
jgi:hypothetical protein